MARDVFRQVYPPAWILQKKSSLDGCDSMLHDDWLDIPGVVIPHSFCFKPGMVSDKNTRRNIFTIMFLCSLHKGITAKSESSCYLPKVLALGQKLVLRKPSICPQVGEVVSPPTSTFVYLSQDSHNEIYNIYDKHMHLQPPFLSLYEQREWGGWRSCVWQCWRDQLIQEISHASMDLMRCL